MGVNLPFTKGLLFRLLKRLERIYLLSLLKVYFLHNVPCNLLLNLSQPLDLIRYFFLMKEFLAISLVRSPDAGVVGYVPYRSEKMVLSDTLDEDVRQSQFATTDTCDQSLNLVLPKVQETVFLF